MIGTGKYNFPGIRKAGAQALNLVLAGTGWGAWLLASPFKPLLEVTEEFLVEWLTNRGLLIIDVTASYVNGQIDQARFDQAFQAAIDRAKTPGLTAAQRKVIDDQVIVAFRRFARIGNT